MDGNLSITYGSGDAHGTLGADNISFGGFQVPNQPFGLVTSSTDQILSGTMSGILGLALGNPAYTAGTPWWVSASSSWLNPQMSFYLTRYVYIDPIL
jgi:cathepsin D